MIYSISARASISDGMQAQFTELTVKAAEYGHVTGRISFGHSDKTAIVPHFLPFSQITSMQMMLRSLYMLICYFQTNLTLKQVDKKTTNLLLNGDLCQGCIMQCHIV